MTWTYRQSTGRISHNGLKLGDGYAGDGSWRNIPHAQSVSPAGPLPRGRYTIPGHFVDDLKNGRLALQLVPDTQNRMFGRSRFFIRGDNATRTGASSGGCIVLPRHVRVLILHSGDRTLDVVA